MKRLSIFIGALLLILVVMGCSKSTNNSDNHSSGSVMVAVDGTDLTLSEACFLNADKAIKCLNAKDWVGVTELFDDYLQLLIPDLAWEKAYEQIHSDAGNFIERMSYCIMYKSNEPVLEYFARYEKKVVLFAMSFNDEAKLKGLTIANTIDNSEWTTCYYDCIYDSEQYIEAFRNKDWKYIRSKSTDLLAAELTDEVLEKAYSDVMPLLGEYHSLKTRQPQKSGDKTVVHHINIHRNGLFDSKVTFSKDGKVSAFYIQPPTGSAPETAAENLSPYAPVVNDVLTEEKIKVVANEKYPLDGLLTLPKNVEKPPVVILLGGSGPSDMNETIMGNMPFKDIAHGLAAKGVAVLRFNKRTLTYGAVMSNAEATVDGEYMDDAAAAIKLLSADARMGKIFLFGHSLGGSLVPAISTAHPELAGVISAAGTLRSLDAVAIEQLNDAIAQTRETQSEAQVKAVESQLQPQLDELKKVSEITDKTPDDVMLFNAPVRYWKELKKYISQELVSQMKHPFLIAQGEADYQVKADVDYKIWQEIACSRENVTCKLYPKLNHLFMPTQGFKNGQEYITPSHVSEEFIADVAAFILAN